MDRKDNLFSKKVLQKRNVANIVEHTVQYKCKLADREPEDGDYERVNAVLNALLEISESSYNTKGSISDKIIDDVFEGNKQVMDAILHHTNLLHGYRYWFVREFQDIVYYLTWFAITEDEPTYNTFKEFAESI